MNNKHLLSSVLAVVSVVFIMSCKNSDYVPNDNASDLILKSYSPRDFTSEPILAGDIETILKCGIKAPSARNMQPWKFIVVKETSVMQQIITNVTEGNVLIVVCRPEANSTADFDCGLATENMVISAQSLGLGARIYTNPVANINSTMKQTLQISEEYRAVAVLRVGNIEKNIDIESTASPRNNYEETVTFL
ncbi:MAG: nitroreductase family protein [Bacteroidales bacterium]|jgi:nitroreductase|nr:nitroreductase family protein [Bacteroidales bacterium]